MEGIRRFDRGVAGRGTMKRRKRTVLILAILAAVLSLSVFLAIRMIGKSPEKALLKILSDKVDLEVRNVRFTEVGDSGMNWEITADTARYQKKENLAIFERMKVRLVTSGGETYVMTGDRGLLHTVSRDMEIEGNVVIVSENGNRLLTDRLRYRNAEKRIESDRPVVMENQTVRISGVGMIFSLDQKKVSLLSQVRAVAGRK